MSVTKQAVRAPGRPRAARRPAGSDSEPRARLCSCVAFRSRLAARSAVAVQLRAAHRRVLERLGVLHRARAESDARGPGASMHDRHEKFRSQENRKTSVAFSRACTTRPRCPSSRREGPRCARHHNTATGHKPGVVYLVLALVSLSLAIQGTSLRYYCVNHMSKM